MDKDAKLRILLGLFVGLLIGMNMLGGKITELLGISVSVGIFMVPLTFLITDIVEEVEGRLITKQFVYTGIITLLVLMVYTALCVKLQPHERYQFNEQYTLIFGTSFRMMIASIVAFALSQLHDVWMFSLLKKKTKGKMLWLRNNISTMLSQAIDTFIFMMIAFYQISDKFTLTFIIQLSIPYYLFKIGFALIDTPLVYMGVSWLRGKQRS